MSETLRRELVKERSFCIHIEMKKMRDWKYVIKTNNFKLDYNLHLIVVRESVSPILGRVGNKC